MTLSARARLLLAATVAACSALLALGLLLDPASAPRGAMTVAALRPALASPLFAPDPPRRAEPAPAPAVDAAPAEDREPPAGVDDRAVPAAAEPLRVRVETTAGAPIGGAEVLAIDADLGAATSLGATDAAGRLALVAQPCDLIEVRAAGRASRRVSLAGRRGDVVVQLGPGRVLVGRVVAHEDGRPLADAVVEARAWADWSREVRTDGAGHFRIDDAPHDEALTLRATHRGRVPALVQPGDLTLIALERGAGLRGRVVDAAGGPVAAEVFVFSRPGPLEAQVAWSGADGRFEVDGLAPGAEVAIVALAPTQATDLRGVAWRRPPGSDEVEVRVEPRGALVLLELPPGAWRVAVEGGPGPLASLERLVDAQGATEARVARLAPGVYRLWRSDEPASEAVEVAPGATGYLRATTPEEPAPARASGAPLRVRVVDGDERPVAGATVIAGAPGAERVAETGASGEVLLHGLGAGALGVWASKAGHVLVAPATLDLAEGEREALARVTLSPSVTLRGRVEGGARLRVRWTDGTLLRDAEADAAGAFALEALPAGEVDLEVTAPDRAPRARRVRLAAPEVALE